MVEAVRGADFLLLVTEPTPFGLHDLRLAVQVGRSLGLPMGVIINRDGIGDESLAGYCESENIPVMMRIPFERAIAEGLARGVPLVATDPSYHDQFLEVLESITAR
jgi:MinD superfamily P-loop ATPase